MKKLFLVALFVMPATFCMNSEGRIGDTIAATLRAELSEITQHKKLLDRKVTRESISSALQKAFGRQGSEHVSYACLDVINQCRAQEISPEAQVYIAGFLDAIAVRNRYFEEHESILIEALRDRVQQLKAKL